MDRNQHIVETAKEAAKLQEIEYVDTISKLDEQIAALQRERHDAMETRRQLALIPKLSEGGCGKEAWRRLSNRRKYEKGNLLAVFSSQNVPQELLETNWNSNAVPEELKNDREILIARASTQAFVDYYTRYSQTESVSIPEPLLDDLEVLSAIAQSCPLALQHPGIPSEMFDSDVIFTAFTGRQLIHYQYMYLGEYRTALENVLTRFSLRIRSTARCMLQAAKVGLNVFPSIAGVLRNDKAFCLELVEVSKLGTTSKLPDDGLKYVSDLLRSDRQVVLSFVEENGCTLKDVAPCHRQDLEIVCAASDSQVAALVHCTGRVKTLLSRDGTFMKNILSQSTSVGHPGVYAMMSADLKLDLEMIVTARQGNCLDVSALPNELSQDPQFWKDALGESSLFWKDLPYAFKLDISFARCITGFSDVNTIVEIVTFHPDLASDIDFWCNAILSSTSEIYDDDIDYLVDEIGSSVRNNRVVMLLACSRSDQLLPALPRDFMLDREFVELTVQDSYSALHSLPFEAQLLYPDLVALAISNFCDDFSDVVDNVNPELWSNLVVAKAWFENQGPIHEDIPAYLREDPDYCLLIVEYRLDEAEDFLSLSLKSSKDFMLRAVKKNPSAFLLASGDLKTDYDITLASFGAVAGVDGLVDAMIDEDNHRAFMHLHSFLHEVQRKLRVHAGVFSLLSGMSAFSDAECRIFVLQQGQETALAMKRRIADYLGSPNREEVLLLRRAAAALERIPKIDPMEFV